MTIQYTMHTHSYAHTYDYTMLMHNTYTHITNAYSYGYTYDYTIHNAYTFICTCA